MAASSRYYECIDQTFEDVETRLEDLDSDPDIAGAEGVLNVKFVNGVTFVLSRQPAVEQLWLATPGGGFHFVWRESAGDWFDTRATRPFAHFFSENLLRTRMRRSIGRKEWSGPCRGACGARTALSRC
jgi:CyaY protein